MEGALLISFVMHYSLIIMCNDSFYNLSIYNAQQIPYHYYSLWEEAYSSQVIKGEGKPSEEVVIGVRENMDSQVTFNLHQKLNSDFNTSFQFS